METTHDIKYDKKTSIAIKTIVQKYSKEEMKQALGNLRRYKKEAEKQILQMAKAKEMNEQAIKDLTEEIKDVERICKEAGIKPEEIKEEAVDGKDNIALG